MNGLNLQRGPDQLCPADDLVTCSTSGAVKLRANDWDIASDPPMSVVTVFKNICLGRPKKVALVDLYHDDNEDIYTYERYYESVIHLAKAFIMLGLECNHGVGIIGYSSPQWFISYMAAIFAGGVAAGMHPSNSPEANRRLADSAECNVIVVDDDEQLEKILQVADSLSHLKAIIQCRNEPKTGVRKVYSWREIMEMTVDDANEEHERRIMTVAPNKCCTLIATSGTSGEPKWVMLSHDNIIWITKIFMRFVNEGKAIQPEVFLSYQSLSHISSILLDIFLPLLNGDSIVYISKPKPLKDTLIKTLQRVRPTFFFGVPKVWETLMNHVLEYAKDCDTLDERKISCAMDNGPFYLDRVLEVITDLIGLDRCHYAMTGGMSCKIQQLHFFRNIGIPLLEVYGASEAGVISVNLKSSHEIGSVGKILAGVQVRLKEHPNGEDGEIYINGRNVFMGYLKDEKRTKAVLDDNLWFRTGDFGKFDRNGFLMLTGRAADFICLYDSRKVMPLPIESRLLGLMPCLSHCVLVGEGRDNISALMVFKTKVDRANGEPVDDLDEKALDWCHNIGLDALTLSDIINCKDGRLKAAIQRAVDETNKRASSDKELIKKWIILPKDFSVKGGELGSTMKLKRSAIIKLYKKEINDLYL